MMAFVLFSAMKNEAPFILEWVSYHRAIGFDRIIVVSNDCDDGTAELLAALASVGEIEHINQFPPEGRSAQANAAMLANAHGLFADGDWVIWLDADEFLNIHAGQGSVQDLAGVMGSRKAMLIPWRIFGDSGNARFPGRHISADFTQAAQQDDPVNREAKTLFRQGPWFRGLAIRGHHRPAVAFGVKLLRSDAVNGAGRPIDRRANQHRPWLAGSDRGISCTTAPSDVQWTQAQINHYSVRTPEHFALKRIRGRGYSSEQLGDTNQRHTPAFYARMNTNTVTDRSILRFEAATTAKINELRAKPGILAAETQAEERVAQMLAESHLASQ